jgi:hypothetical protein
MKQLLLLLALLPLTVFSQGRWQNVDSLFGPLPPGVQVYFTKTPLDSSAFRAYYVSADLTQKALLFSTDTTKGRRLTPDAFYTRNGEPLVVVNGTFFSFQTNGNLNLVVNRGRMLSADQPRWERQRTDSTKKVPVYSSAIGITAKRRADVAWTLTDSATGRVWARQVLPPRAERASNGSSSDEKKGEEQAWKVETAIGGGPVLVQDGKVKITNNEERKFAGKAINDKHPRTAMGYTASGKLIILAVEGRNPEAGGATLTQLAELLIELGCVEALNLDGGGSSCLLVNGRTTIRPSDKEGQRPVPAVFLISSKGK